MHHHFHYPCHPARLYRQWCPGTIMASAVGNYRGINWHAFPFFSLTSTLGTLLIAILPAVIIGCCPGLYRVVKTAISPSKGSYTYESYGMRGRGGSGMPSHRSVGLSENNVALSSFTGKVETYQSASAYRSSSPASSQEKLAHPSDRSNIMVNYGVAVMVEDRSSDYTRTTRFV